MATSRICSIPDCGKPYNSRGWCKAHYLRWRTHGDPLAGGPYLIRGRKCSVDGCDRPHMALGYCGQHYWRLKNQGGIDAATPIRPKRDPICTVEGCVRPHLAKGYCHLHYQRWKSRNDPLFEANRANNGEVQSFLYNTVLPFSGDECLIWPYARYPNGRAVCVVGGRSAQAHRFVCKAIHGKPPTPKHEAAHSCGNGHLGCVNPRHVRWATHKENMADQLKHGTRNRGSRNGQSKLVEGDIPVIRNLLKQGKTITEIGAKFNVSKGTIWQIEKGKAWAWVGLNDLGPA